VGGEQAGTVSAYHAEIRREGDQYRLYDRGSTNGTYLNGRLVSGATLEPENVIRLGPHGPEFLFELSPQQSNDFDATIVVHDAPKNGVTGEPRESNGTHKTPNSHDHDALVAEAVQQVRSARRRGETDQTAVILQKLLRAGVHQSSRPL
jgi:pSer/pThr/pTyr-binding forkhead associated (FHA) protein